MALYTEYERNIQDKVESKKTMLFDTLKEAEAYAKQIRSYAYKVFNGKRAHVCWAVPK
jgi:hypothetical protein